MHRDRRAACRVLALDPATVGHGGAAMSGSFHSGCFICRPEDPEYSDVEGCPACEADFGEYVRQLIDAGMVTDVE